MINLERFTQKAREALEKAVSLAGQHTTMLRWRLSICWLAQVNNRPEYGARPIKRAVQRYLLDPLVHELLE